jgi:hypothetical protein
MLREVVHVHNFRQTFDALLFGADGERSISAVSMLMPVSTTVALAVPLAVESSPQAAKARGGEQKHGAKGCPGHR